MNLLGLIKNNLLILLLGLCPYIVYSMEEAVSKPKTSIPIHLQDIDEDVDSTFSKEALRTRKIIRLILEPLKEKYDIVGCITLEARYVLTVSQLFRKILPKKIEDGYELNIRSLEKLIIKNYKTIGLLDISAEYYGRMCSNSNKKWYLLVGNSWSIS